MPTLRWLVPVVALASALPAAGCASGGRQRSFDAGPRHDAGRVMIPDAASLAPGDGGMPGHDAYVPGHDAGPGHDAYAPGHDAWVAPRPDGGSPSTHDAAASADDAGTSSPDAAFVPTDSAVPRFDIGPSDPTTIVGATRCFTAQPVMTSGVFVGTTCGAIDLVGATCGRPGAPERYFTALGPLAGGHPGYVVEVDPPEFVIQELNPTEVGFDCPAIDGACTSGTRMLTGADITQFMVERGPGGCGEFQLTVTAVP